MHSYRIAVIGAGYVGLTAAACLAALRHRVTCADVDPAKLEMLGRGETNLLEPGMADRVTTGLAAGRLRFVLGAPATVLDAEVVFFCVSTPIPVGTAARISELLDREASRWCPIPNSSARAALSRTS